MSLDRFAAGCARALREAQYALDERARESLDRWDEHGIPPSAWTLGRCEVRASAAFASRGGRRPQLRVAPRVLRRETLTIGFRYLPRPQDDEA